MQVRTVPFCAQKRLLFLLGLFVSSFLTAHAQINTVTQSNASALLAQTATAFSSGKPVNSVQLTGSANWYSGSLEDSGTVTLTASSTGAASMQLTLAKTGSRTESQSDFGMNMTCQWATGDGTIHQGDAMNCIRPVNWFLPFISLQPNAVPQRVGVADMGVSEIGSGTYRHLQSQAVLSSMPTKLLSRSLEASTTDIGIDRNTLLPGILRYQVHPDNGAQINVQIEIQYSDYQKIGGIEIPFLIQRYVNGTLQLEIRVTSAQIN